MSNITLNKSHPSLFKALILKCIVLLLIGLALLINRPGYIVDTVLTAPRALVIPLEVWGLVFMGLAVSMAYGISGGLIRYRWARRALIGGAFITGIWAIVYIFALLGERTDRVFAVIFWIYINLNFIIWAGEPAFNPLSSALSESPNNVKR